MATQVVTAVKAYVAEIPPSHWREKAVRCLLGVVICAACVASVVFFHVAGTGLSMAETIRGGVGLVALGVGIDPDYLKVLRTAVVGIAQDVKGLKGSDSLPPGGNS